MRVAENPDVVISSVDEGRLVFFGPSWGVVVVDVVRGKPVRVQSSWGGDPGVELERLRSWRGVRFLRKPLPEGARPGGEEPSLYGGSVESLPVDLSLPRGFDGLLRRAFPKVARRYSEREWMNAFAVAGELEGVKLLWLRGLGQEGWVLVDRGKVVVARWGRLLNREAVEKLAEDNRLFPLEVEVLSPAAPERAALSWGLPAASEPVLLGSGPAVARGFRVPEGFGLALADHEGYALYRGKAYSSEGEELGAEEVRKKLALSERAALYEATS